MIRILSYQLGLYYLNAFEQRRKALQGLAADCTRSPRAPGVAEPPHFETPTMTTPQNLTSLFLASAGTFLLPILLSAAQLAASRRWPDSDLPRDIEMVKVIVNIAGAAATTIIAALKRWRASRMAAAAAALPDVVVVVEANETTALRAGKKHPSYSMKRAGGRCVTFDAELIDINMKEDQAQMAIVLPVP
jgi:hypothetical protein